jgi:hypothetical protein
MGLLARSVRSAWRGFLCDGLDDCFVLAGVILIGIGLYRLWPAGIWFYLGVVCVGVGGMIPRVRGGP